MPAKRRSIEGPDVKSMTQAMARLQLAATSTQYAARLVMPAYRILPWQHQLVSVVDSLVNSSVNKTHARATLSTAPRVGKTAHVGLFGPIHAACYAYWHQVPRFAILYVTASADRAREVSLQVRGAIAQIHQDTGLDYFAPHPQGPWTDSFFKTKGGFEWRAVGWSTATGGIPADWLIMDDMIGSETNYASPATRQAIQRAVRGDLLARVEGGAGLQMETRRGVDDTTGWLNREFPDVWKQYVWKMYDESRINITGSPYLWPERFGPEWRAQNPHLWDGSPVWRSLYQQEPVPAGGLVLKQDWLDSTYNGDPKLLTASRHYDKVIVGVDLAFSGKTHSDACAFVVLGCKGVFRDVLFAAQKKLEFPAQVAYIKALASEWKPDGFAVEDAATGSSVISTLQSTIKGIRPMRATKDKVTRLQPWTPMIASGQLRLPAMPLPWVREYKDNILSFTGISGEEDHFMDATVWALEGAKEQGGLSGAKMAELMRQAQFR